MVERRTVQVSIVLDDVRASTLVDALREIDRGLRQVPAIAFGDEFIPETEDYLAAARQTPRPISPERGGLLLERASSGSFELVGQLFGEVEALFVSDPATALTNFVTLIAVGRGIWHYFFRRGEEDEVRANDMEELRALLDSAIQHDRKVDVTLKEQSGLSGRAKEIRIRIQ
jgi:hypothetical protein